MLRIRAGGTSAGTSTGTWALDDLSSQIEALEKRHRYEESHMFPMGLVILIAAVITVALAFLCLIDARSDR
jgi:hypothetical protein